MATYNERMCTEITKKKIVSIIECTHPAKIQNSYFLLNRPHILIKKKKEML